MDFQIPYDMGKQFLHVDMANIAGIINARVDEYVPEETAEELIQNALENPIDSPRLRDLSVGKNKIVIITSDHTRSVPSIITLPILLNEIRTGNPEADITILIATGGHRATTIEEQKHMFGERIVANEKIAINNADNPDDFEYMGKLPSGADFYLNKIAAHCDLLISEGFVEPHFFAGFSGGRKSILPGVCNNTTISQNHSYMALSSPYATAGVVENNPVHKDMVFAARQAKLQFILNVTLNSEKHVTAAFAGDMERAHEKAIEFVRSILQCDPIVSDIVVTSNGGYPLDQNLYQGPKAIATAELCCRDSGVIIMCCGCRDGFGGENFQKLMQMGTPEEVDKYLASIPPENTIPQQWCVQKFIHAQLNHKVILVTENLSREDVEKANMLLAHTPNEALEMAYEMLGHDAKVTVIPDGVAVLIN